MSLNIYDDEKQSNVTAILGFKDEDWTSHKEYTCNVQPKQPGNEKENSPVTFAKTLPLFG